MLRHHGTGQAPIFSDCCYAYLERCIVNAARDMLRLKIRQRQQEQQLEAAGTLVSMQQGSGAGSIAELFFWCRMAMQGERNERNREILVARLMQLWLSAEGYSCRLAEVRRLLAERGIEIGEHALRQQANRLLGRLRQRVDNSMIEAMDMEAR